MQRHRSRAQRVHWAFAWLGIVFGLGFGVLFWAQEAVDTSAPRPAAPSVRIERPDGTSEVIINPDADAQPNTNDAHPFVWIAIAMVLHSLVRGPLLLIGREQFDAMSDTERSYRAVSCWWWAAGCLLMSLLGSVWMMITRS